MTGEIAEEIIDDDIPDVSYDYIFMDDDFGEEKPIKSEIREIRTIQDLLYVVSFGPYKECSEALKNMSHALDTFEAIQKSMRREASDQIKSIRSINREARLSIKRAFDKDYKNLSGAIAKYAEAIEYQKQYERHELSLREHYATLVEICEEVRFHIGELSAIMSKVIIDSTDKKEYKRECDILKTRVDEMDARADFIRELKIQGCGFASGSNKRMQSAHADMTEYKLKNLNSCKKPADMKESKERIKKIIGEGMP